MYTIFLNNLERMFMEVSSIVIWQLDITLMIIDDSNCQNSKRRGSVVQKGFRTMSWCKFQVNKWKDGSSGWAF
jgi:hypothetical protein